MNEDKLRKEIEKEGKREVKSPSDIIKYECLKAELKGYLAGKQETLKQVREIIDKQIKNTPYPKDVFIEPSKDDWRKIADLFEDNNFVQDKYFGSEARRVWKLSLEELKGQLKIGDFFG